MSTLTNESTQRGQVTLAVEGMTCASCVGRVERALAAAPGVAEAAVNLTTGLARVRLSADSQPQQLVAAVERAGYNASVMEVGGGAQAMRVVAARANQYETRVKQRLIVGAIAGALVMAMDMLAMDGMGLGISIHTPARTIADWTASSFTAAALWLGAEFFLATVVMFTGWPFFMGAWRAGRRTNMDTLVALGAGLAYLYSLILAIVWIAGSGSAMPGMVMSGSAALPHTELHAAVTIIVLVTLGKFLEARARRAANTAIAGLAQQTAAIARIISPDGSMRETPAEEVAIGDTLELRAHDRAPVDGIVTQGSGSADMSVINGESVPVEVGPGASIPSGAALADGRIVMRATATAASSTAARIVDLVNAAQASKTKIQAMADRVAGVFVPIVLALATLTLAAWLAWPLLHGQPFTITLFSRALAAAIATVVVACPCAMGLATPTAITVAMGAAARRGILFTNAAALESAGAIGQVLFDKTGTLTLGRPRVETITPLPDSGLSAAELLRIAASVEQFSQHPLATAIVQEAQSQNVALMEPTEFSSAPGGGASAKFDAGQEFAVGSAKYTENQTGCHGSAQFAAPCEEPQSTDQKNLDQTLAQLHTDGQTAVVIAHRPAGRVIGVIGLRDTIRTDARSTIDALRATGQRIVVISGDSRAAVEGALRSGQIEVDEIRAGVNPQEKAAQVQEMRRDKQEASRAAASMAPTGIAFVGDGINDAPALAAADLGIALASGTDLAKAAGDVILTGNRLAAVAETLHLSRRTRRIIQQNLLWAYGYNIAMIPLAMLGILPPGVAAGAMMLSSLSVVGNALRLGRPSK